MLATRLSPHLLKLTKTCPAIHRQFVPSSCEEKEEGQASADPLLEEQHTVVRGLVHKYPNRVLVLLTMNCAAYCRFCTRRRKVSDIEKGFLTDKDLGAMAAYIKKHPEVREVIFSGGDPLTVPVILKKAIKKIAALPQIKIVRVGSRLPVSDPKKVNTAVINALKGVKNKPLYIMLNFEHPREITPETVKAVAKLQKVAAGLFSQSIFLKGVNDSANVLYELFSRLLEVGVKPYYIFRCDLVKGAEHFLVDFKTEVKIFTELRHRLSGLACPMYVIDTPHGSGKIPVPTNDWEFDHDHYQDFAGQKQKVR
ncbi:MAG TPA: KamA family radical SAM protein [Patescibacteria group bacterium]|nr:KamA family radical SAM protein [Patescibacteria group bacterium]